MLRTTMVQERLTGLSMLHVHSDLKLNNEDIIDKFESYRPRRMKANMLESE